MNWLDYREKLGIGFSNKERTAYFFTLMFNFLDLTLEDRQIYRQISFSEYYEFCTITGTKTDSRYCDDDYYRGIVSVLRTKVSCLNDYLAHYCAFINCQTENENKPIEKSIYIKVICDNLQKARIPFDIIEDDGVFVFPKGVPEFDQHLVSEPLEWLSSYPLAEKAWSKALREYAEAQEQDASNVADLFRKALETFFQEFFRNDKALENNKSEYGRYLKGQGVPSEISNNLETLVQAYIMFINNYAKHHDRTETKVLEYIMYQTGNIIRLMITLKQEEQT